MPFLTGCREETETATTTTKTTEIMHFYHSIIFMQSLYICVNRSVCRTNGIPTSFTSSNRTDFQCLSCNQQERAKRKRIFGLFWNSHRKSSLISTPPKLKNECHTRNSHSFPCQRCIFCVFFLFILVMLIYGNWAGKTNSIHFNPRCGMEWRRVTVINLLL